MSHIDSTQGRGRRSWEKTGGEKQADNKSASSVRFKEAFETYFPRLLLVLGRTILETFDALLDLCHNILHFYHITVAQMSG